ncbi:uncharacterized protein EI90DRAFT_3081629 [Cantharellus anzutake]|uniref:uncharacterized protein n=1 Tax=Cantharellus anzutake TaxID=1750568 RepID=UPI001903B323|nr:uncharacterized protein EI90DRAFT_3081629 [Cantharellus anzutake]KAF8319842.1 hypothetical protein EI90DRAFT_3081629 [Cantharellus anzutake]
MVTREGAAQWVSGTFFLVWGAVYRHNVSLQTMTSKAPTSFRCIGSGNARARPTVLPKFATSHHGRPFDVATQLGSTPHFLNGCCPSYGFGRDFSSSR